MCSARRFRALLGFIGVFLDRMIPYLREWYLFTLNIAGTTYYYTTYPCNMSWNTTACCSKVSSSSLDTMPVLKPVWSTTYMVCSWCLRSQLLTGTAILISYWGSYVFPVRLVICEWDWLGVMLSWLLEWLVWDSNGFHFFSDFVTIWCLATFNHNALVYSQCQKLVSR